jgi:hypothetical protein
MQRIRARYAVLAGLAAVAWSPIVAAVQAATTAVVYPMPLLSVAATHVVQVVVANVSDPGDPGRTDLAVRGRLLDLSGIELARSESLTVPRGATFSWTIGRAALAVASRDARGRARVRTELEIVGTRDVGAFVPSLELVNELTGEASGMVGDVRTVISAEADLTGTARRGYF